MSHLLIMFPLTPGILLRVEQWRMEASVIFLLILRPVPRLERLGWMLWWSPPCLPRIGSSWKRSAKTNCTVISAQCSNGHRPWSPSASYGKLKAQEMSYLELAISRDAEHVSYVKWVRACQRSFVSPQLSDLAQFMEVINEVIPLSGARRFSLAPPLSTVSRCSDQVTMQWWSFEQAMQVHWIGLVSPFSNLESITGVKMPAAFTPFEEKVPRPFAAPQGAVADFPTSPPRIFRFIAMLRSSKQDNLFPLILNASYISKFCSFLNSFCGYGNPILRGAEMA